MIHSDDKRFSILLVENDVDLCHFVRKSLTESKIFPVSVDQAINLDEAWHKLTRRSYDLVLAESELEEERGLSLWDRMKQGGIDLPFVLMLPISDDELVRNAKKAGVADLLVKSQSHYLELSERLQQSVHKFQQEHRGQKRARRKEEHDDVSISSLERREVKRPVIVRDELTGLYNHGYLHERIVGEFSRASRYGYPLACLMIDLDMFKTLNEDYGYRVGEELLKEAGEILFENCRLSDFISRYGGEEFCVILPHTNYEGANEVAERMKVLFENHRFLADTQGLHLTISIGVSAYPEDSMTLRGELIQFASQALSRSKDLGRNRVTLYRDTQAFFNEGFSNLKINEDSLHEFHQKMAHIAEVSRKSYLEVSKALVRVLETKDKFTAGHSASTAKYCFMIADAMGLNPDEVETIQHAGLLHDIGKIGIPDSILLKPGRLNFTEFETVKQHSYLGYKMLKPIKFLQHEAIFVLHHHEWFNGEGYPCRLRGQEIPLGARIISVADTYDTMRHAGGRYKKTSTAADAVNELIACSGKQFDPEIVRVFIEVLKKRGEVKEEEFNRARLEEILKGESPA